MTNSNSNSKGSSSNGAADNSTLPPLPENFLPGEQDVVIGKGKKFYFHSGNQWLRQLVATMHDEYKRAQTKSDKSNIISDVVEYVRKNGRFVKRDPSTGQWVYAEPLLCREKCSQSFRDNMAETYRSSNVAKRNKRRQEQQDKRTGTSTSTGAVQSEAKRLRTGVASLPALQLSGVNSAIPTQLFDLNNHRTGINNNNATGTSMEMPSLQTQAQNLLANSSGNSAGLDLSGIDLSALTNLLNGSNNNNNNNGNAFQDGHQQQQPQQHNFNHQDSFGSFSMGHQHGNNGHAQAVRRASLSLMRDFPELFAGPAPADSTSSTLEPTPMAGHINSSNSAVQSMAASLYGSLFQNNNTTTTSNHGSSETAWQPQVKRHSLAFADSDWFKLPSDDHHTSVQTNSNTNGNTGTSTLNHRSSTTSTSGLLEKVNAAFAA